MPARDVKIPQSQPWNKMPSGGDSKNHGKSSSQLIAQMESAFKSPNAQKV